MYSCSNTIRSMFLIHIKYKLGFLIGRGLLSKLWFRVPSSLHHLGLRSSEKAHGEWFVRFSAGPGSGTHHFMCYFSLVPNSNTSTLLLKWFFFLIYLFIYLFLAVLGLCFCARAFSSCGKRGPLFIAVRRPLTIAASLIAEHRLQTRRLSNCGSRA